MTPKLSIIISVYQSHEIVRRQMLHFNRIIKELNLPEGTVEILIIDDGSTPPIPEAAYQTGNKLAWTQGLGRNLGASKARGEYLFMTDIDHIISKEALEDALNFTENRMNFRRNIAILDENGDLKQDRETLKDWGYEKEDLAASVHGNTFVIKKEFFNKLGGYSEKASSQGFHPISKKGEDCNFNRRWVDAYRGTYIITGRDIYMFPVGRYNKDNNLNPKGLFHNLHHREEKHYK